MTYEITAKFKVEADRPMEAQAVAAACMEYWDDNIGITLILGTGRAQGSVTIREVKQ